MPDPALAEAGVIILKSRRDRAALIAVLITLAVCVLVVLGTS